MAYQATDQYPTFGGGGGPIAHTGTMTVNVRGIPTLASIRDASHKLGAPQIPLSASRHPSVAADVSLSAVDVGDGIFVSLLPNQQMRHVTGAPHLCGWADFGKLDKSVALAHTRVIGLADTPYRPMHGSGLDRPTFAVAMHGTRTTRNNSKRVIFAGQVVACVPPCFAAGTNLEGKANESKGIFIGVDQWDPVNIEKSQLVMMTRQQRLTLSKKFAEHYFAKEANIPDDVEAKKIHFTDPRVDALLYVYVMHYDAVFRTKAKKALDEIVDAKDTVDAADTVVTKGVDVEMEDKTGNKRTIPYVPQATEFMEVVQKRFVQMDNLLANFVIGIATNTAYPTELLHLAITRGARH